MYRILFKPITSKTWVQSSEFKKVDYSLSQAQKIVSSHPSHRFAKS